jgi:hypothetical protein
MWTAQQLEVQRVREEAKRRLEQEEEKMRQKHQQLALQAEVRIM